MLKIWWCWYYMLPLSFSWNCEFCPCCLSLSLLKLWVWSHLSYSHQLEGANENSSRWAVSGVATFFNSNRKSKVIKRERNKDLKFFIDHQRLPSRFSNSDRGPSSKTLGLVLVCPGRSGHGSIRRVDRVLSDCCPRWFFSKPGPVQPPDRPGPRSTRLTGLGLKTMAAASPSKKQSITPITSTHQNLKLRSSCKCRKKSQWRHQITWEEKRE